MTKVSPEELVAMLPGCLALTPHTSNLQPTSGDKEELRVDQKQEIYLVDKAIYLF